MKDGKAIVSIKIRVVEHEEILQQTRDPKVFPFQQLPPELQTMILEYALAYSGSLSHGTVALSMVWQSHKNFENPYSLLAVCKSFHRTGVELFYARNTLQINIFATRHV